MVKKGYYGNKSLSLDRTEVRQMNLFVTTLIDMLICAENSPE